jgi:uncharacterized membrane protein YfcA
VSIAVLLALALVGLAVGFTSGLVGIGGGVLIVPFLYFFYAHPSWSQVVLAQPLHTTVAHATSLFVIIPTALLGTRSYQKAKLIVWRAALPIALVSIFSAIAGARAALVAPGPLLRIGFGVFLLLTAAQLLLGRKENERPLRVRAPIVVITGLVVGFLSGLMGIGGGAVAAPLLIHVIGVRLKQAAATSLAIVAFASLAGTTTYALSGVQIAGMPPGSVGYIHVAAAIPILIASMISVRWGTLVNQRLPHWADGFRRRRSASASSAARGSQAGRTCHARLW